MSTEQNRVTAISVAHATLTNTIQTAQKDFNAAVLAGVDFAPASEAFEKAKRAAFAALGEAISRAEAS